MVHIFLDMREYSMKKIIILLFMFMAFSSSIYAAEPYNKIYTVSIDGVITDATASYISSTIEKAENENIPVIIYIDTPGGVLESTRKIVQTLLSAKVPVISYVYPNGARAASAGMFAAMAAEYAVMSESSNIGAAHPVSSNGEDIKGDMAEKVLNDTVALIKSIAEKRGKNIEAAVSMVKDSKSYTSLEALKLNIIDAVSNYDGLIKVLSKKYNISENPEIINLEPDFKQEIYNILANPDFLAALLFLGIVLLMLEIKMPGSFIFAGLGILCFTAFAFGANIIPINFLGITLIFISFGLFIAEFFITSFGLLTVAGVISMIFGLRMLFDSEHSAGIAVSLWVILIIVGMILLIALLLGRLIMKDFVRRPASGPETMLDKEAEVIEWEGMKGRVKIYEEIWNAVSDEEIKINDTVIITKVDGLTLKVKKK